MLPATNGLPAGTPEPPELGPDIERLYQAFLADFGRFETARDAALAAGKTVYIRSRSASLTEKSIRHWEEAEKRTGVVVLDADYEGSLTRVQEQIGDELAIEPDLAQRRLLEHAGRWVLRVHLRLAEMRVEAKPGETAVATLAEPGRIIRVEDLPDLEDLDIPPVPWLVEDLIIEGGVTLVSADYAGGKTWFAQFLAIAVQEGHDVLGRKVQQRAVLYVDGENPASVVHSRMVSMQRGNQPPGKLPKVWGNWNSEPPPPANDSRIVAFAKKHKPLIIIDSLIAFNPYDNENDAVLLRRYMDQFGILARRHGTSVLVLHHKGKGENTKHFRGSSDIAASVDLAFTLEKVGTRPDGKLGKLKIDYYKQREVSERPLKLLEYVPPEERPEDGDAFIEVNGHQSPAAVSRNPLEVVKEIVGENPGRLNKKQITALAEGKGVTKYQVEKCLAEDTVFVKRNGVGNEKLYSLAEEDSVESPSEKPPPS